MYSIITRIVTRIEHHIKIYIPLIFGLGLGPKNKFLYKLVFA